MTSRPKFPGWRTAVWLVSLFVLAGTLGLQGGMQGDLPIKPRPQKNPKLSTRLVELARSVRQQTGPAAAQAKRTAPKGFSIATLPKSSRDAIATGQMKVTATGEVQVYIEMNDLSTDTLSKLRSYGVTVQIVSRQKPDKTKGEVRTTVPTVQGMLPIERIDAVAALPFVRYIRLPDYVHPGTGSVTSQGDALLMAAAARQQYGLDGTGIKIGVISDGIGGIFATNCTVCGATSADPSPMLTGDLPQAIGARTSSGVLFSASGGIIARSFVQAYAPTGNLAPPTLSTTSGVASEGTAMMEIVHDLAPGAQLYFANASTTLELQYAVDWIDENVDIGVDDLGAFTPPFDGTSDVSANTANALNTDLNPVRGYFTSVGNYAFNHWAEPWTDSGQNRTLVCPGNPATSQGNVQLFQATAKTKDLRSYGALPANLLVVPAGAQLQVILTWNDPFSGSSNDYDLYLYQAGTSALTPVACSADPQDGTQPPVESLSFTNNTGSPQTVGIYIQNFNNAAAARTFNMFVVGIGNSRDLNYYTPAGSVPAQSDAGGSPVSVVSVGATYAGTGSDGTAPATVIEPFSSQGPTEATPQAAARMKPDVTATDGVSITGAGGFGVLNASGAYFFGTSAAAPHAAAVAGLALQAAPCLLSSSTLKTPAEARARLRGYLTSTAVPLAGVSEPAPNNIEGYGLLNALAAASGAIPTARASSDQAVNATSASGATVSLSGTGTDPNSCPLTFNWSGDCGTATGANVSVTCPAGLNTERLTASNGGATKGLPGSDVKITVSDFSATASPASATVQKGQSASYTIAVNAEFGSFTNPVSLTCSGLPSLSSCAFSPATVTPGSGSASSTLTISTTAASALPPSAAPRDPGPWPLIAWFVLLFLLAAFTLAARKNRKRVAVGIASCALLLLLLAPVFSCGGDSTSGTPPPSDDTETPSATYTVTVTGTSNQLQHSTTVSLTVQD